MGGKPVSIITSRGGYLFKVLDNLLNLYSRDNVIDNKDMKVFLYGIKDGYAIKILEKFTSGDDKIFAEVIVLAEEEKTYQLINEFRKLLITWDTFLGLKIEAILKLEEVLVNKYKVAAEDLRQSKIISLDWKIKLINEQVTDVNKMTNYDLEHLLINPRDYINKYKK